MTATEPTDAVACENGLILSSSEFCVVSKYEICSNPVQERTVLIYVTITTKLLFISIVNMTDEAYNLQRQ